MSAPAPETAPTSITTARLLGRSRMEVIPGDGVAARIRAVVARELALSVTCLAAHGPDRAVELACELADAGYRVMPHLAAHSVTDRRHLRTLLGRCADHGIDELLVVGGDADLRAGAYPWAGALVQDVLAISPGTRVSVAGYPQGHPRFSDHELWAALRHKLELGAASVVTQMCFDHRAYRVWLDQLGQLGELDQFGHDVPVWLGSPGLVRRARAARIARRIGVAEAARFARGNRRALLRLMLSRHFRPQHLIGDVLADVGAHATQLAGVHLYSFNEIERTAAWREAYLGRALGR